jgi:tRNA threonylcarbamoyl adenosine modification protein YeaZ
VAENNLHRNILCIESAVGDGSISLWREGAKDSIRSEIGSASRAEKIIGAIDALLREASFSKADLDLIALSNGPGSYSGIRIGISTAYGLAHALGIGVVGVSILEAIAYSSGAERLITAVPVGKGEVAWQVFETDVAGGKIAGTPPQLTSLADFGNYLNSSNSPCPVVGPRTLLDRMNTIYDGGNHPLMDPNEALASAIGRLVSRKKGTNDQPTPIYLRSAVARASI